MNDDSNYDMRAYDDAYEQYVATQIVKELFGMDTDLEKLTELETLEYYHNARNMEVVALRTEMEQWCKRQGYLKLDKNGKTYTLTDLGVYRMECSRHEQTKAQLERCIIQRDSWERIAHGSLDAIHRIAATLDIPTQRPDSVLGVGYAELERAILEALEDMAK